ncbi:hypothetical protein K438DRAFT_2000208 [Mycena galopus ATCC 62051]|nr:hypothetical protein K438DRAFT_2000208 [Mycena galopus ATCC 62051]
MSRLDTIVSDPRFVASLLSRPSHTTPHLLSIAIVIKAQGYLTLSTKTTVAALGDGFLDHPDFSSNNLRARTLPSTPCRALNAGTVAPATIKQSPLRLTTSMSTTRAGLNAKHVPCAFREQACLVCHAWEQTKTCKISVCILGQSSLNTTWVAHHISELLPWIFAEGY